MDITLALKAGGWGELLGKDGKPKPEYKIEKMCGPMFLRDVRNAAKAREHVPTTLPLLDTPVVVDSMVIFQSDNKKRFPKLDQLHLTNDDLQSKKVVGNVRGIPVIEIDFERAENRTLTSLQNIIIANQIARAEQNELSYFEILPGEAICNDNVIRRTTTSEAKE